MEKMPHRHALLAMAATVLLSASSLSATAAQTKQRRPAPAEPATEIEEVVPATLPESVRAERVLAKNPQDRAARLRAARAQLAEGAEVPSRIEAARHHALAVLAESPNDIEALLLAGQTSLLEKDADAAARYYRAATLADVNNATAFLGLGDALSRLGDDTGATAAFARYRALLGMPALQSNNQ
jgi:hypothetical protein